MLFKLDDKMISMIAVYNNFLIERGPLQRETLQRLMAYLLVINSLNIQPLGIVELCMSSWLVTD